MSGRTRWWQKWLTQLVQILIFLSGPGAISQQVLYRVVAGSGDALGGAQVTSLGDIDGDGIEDFVTGSRPGQFVRAYSGAHGTVIWSVARSGTERFADFVVSCGDVDGDGFADVLVASPGHVGPSGNGAVYVLSGRTGSQLRVHEDTSGMNMIGGCDVGDVDGDGYEDYALQSWSYVAGLSRLISGRTGQAIHDFVTGHDDSPGFVTRVGDLDDDGYDDFLINGLGCVPNVGCYGVMDAYSGGSQSLLYRRYGIAPGDFMVANVMADTASLAPDLDGDGVPDFVASGRTYDSQGQRLWGYLRAYSGRGGRPIWTTYGLAVNYGSLGIGLAVTSDYDGDGVLDLLAPATGHGSSSLTDPFLILSGANGQVLLAVNPPSGIFYNAGPITALGDVNGDGQREVAVATNVMFVNAGGVAVVALPPPATALAYHRSLGKPCPGSDGHLPHLLLHGEPRLGSQPGLRLRGALAQSAAVLLLGAPASVPLDPFGGTGCTLLVDPFWISPPLATDPRGMARMPVSVPNQPSLTGARLQLQWAIVDPMANAAGVTLSDATRIQLGR